MTIRTTRGMDNSADTGMRRLVWILIMVSFDGAWLPVIFGFGRLFTPKDQLDLVADCSS